MLVAWMHKNANLTEQQKVLIVNWAEILRKEIASKHDVSEEKK